MDERTRLFFWLLGGEGVFALLGGLFGGVTGFVHGRDGRVAGTPVGQGVARAYARLAETSDGLSTAVRGTLSGAADGLVFGLFAGTLVGLVAAWHGPDGWAVFRPVVLTGLFLVATALALGGFAAVVRAVGVRAVLALFTGAMAGGLFGLARYGADGLFVGTLAGAALGAGAAWLRR